MGALKYLVVGAWFGLLLTKAEVISFHRIRSMFLFREPDLYLVIGSAVVTGILAVRLLMRFRKTTLEGDTLVIPGKALTHGNWMGGFLFGMGWFIIGACPGPIFAQIGAGEVMAWVALAGAVGGTYVYARFRHRLPH